MKEIIKKLEDEDAYSKMQIDLRFNAKQMNIGRVGIVKPDGLEKVKSEYPEKEQTTF